MNKLLFVFCLAVLTAVATAQHSYCEISGDPHVKTFDGTWYDVYGVADYVAVKDTAHNFFVQARTIKNNCKGEECTSIWADKIKQPYGAVSASWTIGAAFSAHNTKVEVDGWNMNKMFVNAQQFNFPSVNNFHQVAANIRGLWRGGVNYYFEITFGSDVVKMHMWGDGVKIEIPTSWQNTIPHIVGLCGYFDGKQSDEFIGADGTNYPPNENQATHLKLANYKFETSYMIKASDNIMIDAKQFPQLAEYVRMMTENKASILKNDKLDDPKWASENQRILAEKACAPAKASGQYAYDACLFDMREGAVDPLTIQSLGEEERRALRDINLNNVLGCPDLAAAEEKLNADRRAFQTAIDEANAKVAAAKAAALEKAKAIAASYPKEDIDALQEERVYYESEISRHKAVIKNGGSASLIKRTEKQLDGAIASLNEVLALLAAYNNLIRELGALQNDVKVQEALARDAANKLKSLDKISADLALQREACRENCEKAIQIMSGDITAQQNELNAAQAKVNTVIANQGKADAALKANIAAQEAKRAAIAAAKNQATQAKEVADVEAEKINTQLAIIEAIVNKTVELESRNHAQRVVDVLNELMNTLKAKKPFAQWATILHQITKLEKELNDLVNQNDEILKTIDALKVELKSASIVVKQEEADVANVKAVVDAKTAQCKGIKVAKDDVGRSNTNPAASCNQIAQQVQGVQNGQYFLKDKNGNVYQAKCAFENGAGYTLAMKMNWNDFPYNSPYWTNQDLINQNNFDASTGAKYASFFSVPVNNVRIVMNTNGNVQQMTFAYQASSLLDIFANGQYKSVAISRSQWQQMVPNASLQPNCAKTGFNVHDNGGWQFTSVRIGIIANQEGDCNTPDSRIGLGGFGTACGQNGSVASGNTCRCGCDKGDKDVGSYGEVWVK
jgi:hypothetical protein